jgi:hypothetical protein
MSTFEAVVLFVVLQVTWVFLIRTFPDFIGGALLKSIDRRNSIEIENLRNELNQKTQRDLEHLRADYATLKSSTDFLTANQSELRSKMIAATEMLWNSMLEIRKSLGDVTFIETVFLPGELEEAFSGRARADLISPLEKYRHQGHVASKVMEHGIDNFSKQRLFVGDRLWLIYYVFGGLHFRIGLLVQRSFKESKYSGWRDDNGIRQLLIAVLGEERVKPLYTNTFPMMSSVIATLEAEFLKEAMRIMSGSKFFAESVTDVQATLQFETQRAREAGL